MKNQIALLQSEGVAQLKALEAIQKIFQAFGKVYSSKSLSSQSLLIRECLNQIASERIK